MNENIELDRKVKPERNPITHKAHRREVFWQITLPLSIGLVFILTLALLALVAATRGGNVAQAADTSLIFLIIPLMCATMLFTVVFAAVTYGIIKLNGRLPGYTKQVQDALWRLRQQVQTGSDKLVEPVFKIQSFFASFRAFKRK